jgi:TP901 family phage tail tape measure protein
VADVVSNILIDVNTKPGIIGLRQLQSEISRLNRSLIVGSKVASTTQRDWANSLLRSTSASGRWTSSINQMRTASEQFADRLDRNKLSLREYVRYSVASSKTLGKAFSSLGREQEVINKVVERRVKTLQSQYLKLGRTAQGTMQAMRFMPKQLNMDDVNTRLMTAIQRQQIFNKLLSDGSTRLLNFGKNTQWAGRQLMVGFTVPLAMLAAASIKTFKEIEEQTIRFRKVYGEAFTNDKETDAALANIRKLATEYTKYGIKVSETLKMAADAAQMGNMGDALIAQVEQATKLAVLGGVEQEKALETTVSLTNAFKLSTDDLGKSVNFLNAVENQTILSIEDLTEAIPKAGNVVKQLGGDVEDLAFFMVAMREGGISASQGANALKSSLARMINPTKAARNYLSDFGIDIMGIVDRNTGNIKQSVLELAVELDKLGSTDRARAIEKVFGKYQFTRISTLLQNVVSQSSQANRVLAITNQSAETLAILSRREMKIQEESQMNKLASAVEKLKEQLAPIGELFAEMLQPIVNFFQRMLQGFNNLPDGIKKAIGIILGVVGGLGPILLMTIGLLANMFANSLKFFNILRVGYQRLAYGSKDAALSTSYLTQENLENIASTQLLTQEHIELSSAYRLENTALQNLIGSYGRLAGAMNAVRASSPGLFIGGTRPITSSLILPSRGPSSAYPRTPTLGANKGAYTVPGPRVDKDIVPAMLTPGEAVIPRKQAQKYRGLIKAIIANRIPGFIDGVPDVPKDGFKVTDKRVAGQYAGFTPLPKAPPGVLVTDSAAAARANSRMQERLNNTLKRVDKAFTRVQKTVNTTSTGFQKVNTTIKETDKTTGVRGYMSGYRKVPMYQTDSQGTVMKLTPEERANARQEQRMRFSGKMMPFQMGAMMLPMAAGMQAQTNPDGFMARNMNAMMGVTALAMMLPMLNSPMKILAATTVGLVAAFKMQAAQIKQSLIDGQAQAQAMSMTNERLISLSESLGRVSKFEEAREARLDRVTGLTPVEQDFGYNFINENEAGKKFAEDFNNTMSILGRDMGADSLAQQLGTLVTQQVLTASEAESIAVALTRSLNDQQLELSVRAKLTAIVGPDGQDILSNPLGVQVRLQSIASQQQGKFFEDLNETASREFGIMWRGGGADGERNFLNPMNYSEGNQLVAAGAAGTAASGIRASRAYFKAAADAADATKAAEQLADTRKVATSAGVAGKAVTALKGARNVGRVALGASAVATAGSFGAASPALAAAALNFAIGETITLAATIGLRKWQQGKEKTAVAEAAGKLSGAVSESISLGQQGIDAVNAQYSQGIENLKLLKAKAKTEEEKAKLDRQINELEVNRLADVQSLRSRQAGNVGAAAQYFEGIESEGAQEKFYESFTEGIKEQFKKSPLKKDAESLVKELNKVEDKKVSLTLASLVQSETLSPAEAETLLTTLTRTGTDITKTIDAIIKVQGTEGLDRYTNILTMLDDEQDAIFTARIDVLNEKGKIEEIEGLYTAIEQLSILPAYLGIEVNTEVNQESLKDLSKTGEEIDQIEKAFPDRKVTKDLLINYQNKIGGPDKNLTLDRAIENWEIIQGLPAEKRFQAIFTLSVLTQSDNVQDDIVQDLRSQFATGKISGTGNRRRFQEGIFQNWLKSDAGKAALEKARLEYLQTTMPQIFGTGAVLPDGGDGGGGDGKDGKVDSSWLDEWVKRLRDVRDNTIKATKGFEASMAMLKKVLGGNKDIKLFSGIEQDLTKLGLSDNFINIITGMDPEEFKKRKDDLFKFDNKGNIVRLKEQARVIKKVINEVTLGAFQQKQLLSIQTTKNQTKAIERLIKAGLSTKDAYEGVADAAFAAEVASKKVSDEELKELVDTWNKASNAISIYNAQSALFQKNQDFKSTFMDTFKAIDLAKGAFGDLPDEIINLIQEDANVRTLILNGKFNDNQLLESLQNAVNKKELEIKIKMQTREGMQSLFEEGYSKAMEWFDAQEQKINLDFEFNTLGDKKIIEKAEDTVAAIEYRLDDLQAELVEIDEAEKIINDKYDERVKALDQVAKINEDILEQEKSQLTIADALTKGDISAAAAAVQEMRQQQAGSALDRQKESITAARELEISQIRNSLGRTRAQIEKEIKDLQKEIFDIEEKTLEPARERIRLADIVKRDAIDSLTLLGKTKLEWEQVKNRVDLAKTSSQEYQDAIKLALGLVEDLINKWNSIQSKKIFLEIETIGGGGVITPPTTPSGTTIDGYDINSPSVAPAPNYYTAPDGTRFDTYEEYIAYINSGLFDAKNKTKKIGGGGSGDMVFKAKGGLIPYMNMGGMVKIPKAEPAPVQRMNMGGKVKYMPMGGLVPYMNMGGAVPKYMPMGGLVPYMNMGGIFKPKGTDTVPAMLTPGEFVIRKYAVKDFGLDKLKAINEGTYNDGSVYNYNLNVNVKSESNPDDIANAVMMQIKRIDGQRIRGNRQ